MFKRFIIFLAFLTFALADETSLIREAYFKSYAYEKEKNYEAAIKSLSRLHKKYPKGYTLNLRMGYLYFLNKQYDIAIDYYKSSSEILPKSNESKLGLTRVYLKKKSYKKAQKIALGILKIDYYSFYGNLYAIEALVGQEEYKTALAIINKMLAIFPTNIIYLEQLAILYKKTNHKYLNSVYESLYLLDPQNELLQNK